jgi:hypothetical protein
MYFWTEAKSIITEALRAAPRLIAVLLAISPLFYVILAYEFGLSDNVFALGYFPFLAVYAVVVFGLVSSFVSENSQV